MVKTCCRPVLRSFAARGSESYLSFSQRGLEDNNKRALQKKGSLSAHLSMRFLVSALGLREAVAAVNRAAVARLEGHLSLAAACGTDSGEHLTGTAGGGAAATTAGLFPGLAAGRATFGLVGEALGSEELLLGSAEGEISAAVCALDDFVLGHGMTLAPFFIILWFTVRPSGPRDKPGLGYQLSTALEYAITLSTLSTCYRDYPNAILRLPPLSAIVTSLGSSDEIGTLFKVSGVLGEQSNTIASGYFVTGSDWLRKDAAWRGTGEKRVSRKAMPPF